jgi:hypothetical protein
MTVAIDGFFAGVASFWRLLAATSAGCSGAGVAFTSLADGRIANTAIAFKRYDYVNPDAPKGGTLNSNRNGDVRQLQSLYRARHAGGRLRCLSAADCSTTR